MSKSLVAFFSASGVTAKLAANLAEAVGGGAEPALAVYVPTRVARSVHSGRKFFIAQRRGCSGSSYHTF